MTAHYISNQNRIHGIFLSFFTSKARDELLKCQEISCGIVCLNGNNFTLTPWKWNLPSLSVIPLTNSRYLLIYFILLLWAQRDLITLVPGETPLTACWQVPGVGTLWQMIVQFGEFPEVSQFCHLGSGFLPKSHLFAKVKSAWEIILAAQI